MKLQLMLPCALRLCAMVLLMAVSVVMGSNSSRAAANQNAYASLATIKPVEDCTSLAATDLHPFIGTDSKLQASTVKTDKGEFCRVKGVISPTIGFEVDLPTTTWTQRFIQSGCGGLCGAIHASIGNAGSCFPATDGQFVLAATDMGHEGHMGSPDEAAFGDDPQKRIDFAYRANHLTALAAKALMRAYYGQSPKYSYFSGCSDGGREALEEAQRFPDDFDGISAGAPAMLFGVQNTFWHAWMATANLRKDGTAILTQDKLVVLHNTVLAHCDMLDGNKDNLLSDPRMCQVQESWVECPSGASDTKKCLTHEEWLAADRFYTGPRDDQGHYFLPGGVQPGTELAWIGSGLPSSPKMPHLPAGGFSGLMVKQMAKVVYDNPVDSISNATDFPFTMEQYAKVNKLHALYDATNTDLNGFAARGGRLLMWQGWSDTSIGPRISVTYYAALKRDMGDATVDGFMRLFMIPGVQHCGGGDGFPQIDTLSPLMAWVEKGKAPKVLIADRVADAHASADGRGGQTGPYASESKPALASRPIFPFPMIGRYVGRGDPSKASSYASVMSTAGMSNPDGWYGAGLLSSDFQKNWSVENKKLAVTQ